MSKALFIGSLMLIIAWFVGVIWFHANGVFHLLLFIGFFNLLIMLLYRKEVAEQQL